MRHQLTLLILALLINSTALGASRDELESEVASLNDRVSMLEQKIEQLLAHMPQPEPGASSVLLTQNKPDPATEMAQAPKRFSMGGIIKVDLIGNSVSTGQPGGSNYGDLSLLPQLIPLDNTGEHNQTSASARASRLWVKATSPTSLGELGAYLEFDFSSNDGAGDERATNSYNPRLRHAYATFRNFTIGQTSSTFLNTLAYPEVNEGFGPAGILNIRQPLVRYTRQQGDWHWFLAAEQPETVIRNRSAERLSLDDDRLPDLIGRIEKRGAFGSWSMAALVRQLRMDDTHSDTARGVGLSTSGRLYLSNANNVRFALTYGEGLGRYINYNGFDDALLDPDNNLEPVSAWSGYLAYQHWWSENWRTNISVGYASADIDEKLLLAPINERYRSTHLNLLWSPVPDATFGLEWAWAERVLTDGQRGDINKLQFTSTYKFRQR